MSLRRPGKTGGRRDLRSLGERLASLETPEAPERPALTSSERRRRIGELVTLARARLAAGVPRTPTSPVLLARLRELRAKEAAWVRPRPISGDRP